MGSNIWRVINWCEIAAQRTMISFRPDLKIEKLTIGSGKSTNENVKIALISYR